MKNFFQTQNSQDLVLVGLSHVTSPLASGAKLAEASKHFDYLQFSKDSAVYAIDKAIAFTQWYDSEFLPVAIPALEKAACQIGRAAFNTIAFVVGTALLLHEFMCREDVQETIQAVSDIAASTTETTAKVGGIALNTTALTVFTVVVVLASVAYTVWGRLSAAINASYQNIEALASRINF